MTKEEAFARLHYAMDMFFENCTFDDTRDLYAVLADRSNQGETMEIIFTHTEAEAANVSNPPEGIFALWPSAWTEVLLRSINPYLPFFKAHYNAQELPLAPPLRMADLVDHWEAFCTLWGKFGDLASTLRGNVRYAQYAANETARRNENSKRRQKLAKANYVTFANAIASEHFGGRIEAQVGIVVRNIGNTYLHIDDSTYDLEDAEGKIVATSFRTRAYPQIIRPKENAYLFDTISIDVWTKPQPLAVVLHLNADTTSLDPIRLDVPEFYLTDLQHNGGIKMLGRVENRTEDVQSSIAIGAILFDEKDRPFGMIPATHTGEVAPGAKVGFDGAFPIKGISCSHIARYEVFAFPRQEQL